MNQDGLEIREMNAEDWHRVALIYKEGMETGNATFQQIVPQWDDWNESHLPACRLVATVSGQVVGWAALSPVSKREVYAGVAEISIYVTSRLRGFGIGAILLEKTILESEKQNIWTLQAGIFPENVASIKMHQRLGFREIGYREKIGKMKNKWRNTILLERRSLITGVDHDIT
jgi:L-amino acid N-acyltransferase YncA